MTILDTIRDRKTTYEFDAKKVPARALKIILEAGRWAPSCTNTQPWHFIVVKDPQTISDLMMTANYGDFHTDPPLLIALVLLSDRCAGEGHSCFRGTDSGVYDTYMSVGIAGYAMTLAATDLGLGSCIITPEQSVAKKILKVQKKDAVPLLIGIGTPKKGGFVKARVRRDIKEITSEEIFGGTQ